MAARRKNTFRLSLTPGTEAELLRLKECGENRALLTRCAAWRSSPTQLEACIVLKSKRYAYQVGESGPWGEGILPGRWQPIEFDDAAWRATASMQGAWVRDWTQRGARTDLLAAQAAPPPEPAPPPPPPDVPQPNPTLESLP